MSPIEPAAALLGLFNIVLIIRRSVWNFPFAIAMVVMYAAVFFSAKLYSDAGLQIFFLIVNVYGWWAWTRNEAQAGEIVVERLSPLAFAGWMIGSVAAIALWGTFMARNTDASYPWWDASVLILSIVGQILMTRRYLENWHWWIVVNMISVPLYWIKSLHWTAGLYAIFLVLAVVGLVEWLRAEKVTKQPS